ncbi:MAG: class I SAM-dependent methyltransferase [Gammaproteobacteria bacterium]|nr:class I SAM-dependent methyltransferase [Gammaproteobacteria bacterium]
MGFTHIPDDRLQRIFALGYDYSVQPKERIHLCNLCGATEHTQLAHIDRYGYEATAVACSVCGLTFLNPVMSGEAYADFYTKIYRPLVSAYHGRLIDVDTIQDEQMAYAEVLAEFLRPWLDSRKSNTLLDVGGSTGVVARELVKTFSINAVVLDPAADELKSAVGAGLEVIPGFIEQYDPMGREYDLVTLCQTIDHLSDALGSLRKIHNLLKQEGLFFVDIVDFRAAYLRQGSIEGAIKIDHPYYFTEDTAEVMLSRAGFKVLQKNYFSDNLHVGYICSKKGIDSTALPDTTFVREYFREIRYIQNARR